MTSPSEPRAARRSSAASPLTTPPSDAAVPVVDASAVRDMEDVGEVLGNACFGCGPDVPHGLRIRRTGHDGSTAYAEFTVQPEHQGAPGLAHGGILASAMDEILGTSAWLLGGRYVTGRLETDYLAPVPVGSVVHLTARCTGVDGRKAYIEGEARLGGPDGPIAVRAASIFIKVPLEHFTKER
ncbi:Acyl-coenzyme A thioesterase PaaI, contains HGG motif [Thermomonospora echinospora]|uniref:Acyl-coenzyme A thioesterase THEM4 n=1 Tax=Thermomonospora echinospora TaxID=1992 RepID=A0A1H6CAQ6_9ACTN|nr:PaaI family thioesterase [Thermomonospora echinospora]SEG69847.1 Acyl-coenzyme A thioesterase PaaI, contains HGG motif [Thermomonospora echinospora]